jgi:hypothetical protein
MQANTGQHDRLGGQQELGALLDQFEIEASGFEAASAQWLR